MNIAKHGMLNLNYFKLLSVSALALAFSACSPASSIQPVTSVDEPLTGIELDVYQRKLATTLSDPVARSKMIAKVLGTTEKGERHAFMKFHVFGFAGDGNLIPFFTMNNYIIQNWTPSEDGDFEVAHREVAYYSKFDTEEAINDWENPLTGEVVELPHFVLGPVPRVYGPSQSDSKASFSSDPMNITMIGDRVYIPTLSSFSFPNSLSVEEWGPYSSGPKTYWDSMQVFSADVEDVFDDEKSHVDAEIHMQNLVSWAPYLKLGQYPGRTMVRAYGQHVSGYDALPINIRKNFEQYTPEIFDVENWTELRMDSIELAMSLQKKRANGTLDIDQEDYKPFIVKSLEERNK